MRAPHAHSPLTLDVALNTFTIVLDTPTEVLTLKLCKELLTDHLLYSFRTLAMLL